MSPSEPFPSIYGSFIIYTIWRQQRSTHICPDSLNITSLLRLKGLWLWLDLGMGVSDYSENNVHISRLRWHVKSLVAQAFPPRSPRRSTSLLPHPFSQRSSVNKAFLSWSPIILAGSSWWNIIPKMVNLQRLNKMASWFYFCPDSWLFMKGTFIVPEMMYKIPLKIVQKITQT